MSFFKKIKALFTKSENEKTSLQKTARISIIFAAVALVGVIVYFAVIAPLLHTDENYVPELFEGEMYQYSSIYILPIYESSKIQSVEIKNSVEHYKLNAYQEDNVRSFQIEGSEDIGLNQEALASLLADVRVLITNYIPGQERVTVTATEEDLARFGLDEASDPAWFEVVLTDGDSYRIYIGNSLTTSKGYYARLEGRKNKVTEADGSVTEYDIIYALPSSISETVLSTSNFMISTDLAPYFGNTIFAVNDFTLTRILNDERKVIVRIGTVKDQGVSSTSNPYEMLFPKAYVVDEDIYSGSILNNLAYVRADEIVAYGKKIHDPEVYEAFGLDLDEERLDKFEDNNHAVVTFKLEGETGEDGEEEISTILYFSEKRTDENEMEYYYVYSPLYEVIGKVSAETYDFVDWQLAKFTSPYLFYEYLTNTEVIDLYSEIKGFETDTRFEFSGKERSLHVDVLKSSNGEIVYTESEDGKKIPLVFEAKYRLLGNSGHEYYGEFENFRNLFYVLLTREFDLYDSMDYETMRVVEKPVATLSITTIAKDHPISYFKYKENGDRDGSSMRDQGGNYICTNVVVPSAIEGGKDIVYEKAYYDPEAGRFFLKTVDPKDGYDKPTDFKASEQGTVEITTYLPIETYGEYVETTYHYEFHYIEYIDGNGGAAQLNSTRMYVVPTMIKTQYKIFANGQKELIKEEKEIAEEGVYIRSTVLNKLFSDTKKVLNGEEIDKKEVN
ncbi:MAG: DUF4340 domain-containing protein [Clostridia bacterium]|nr:DUF4340 domain-containing protein [Clostridia bacterium]